MNNPDKEFFLRFRSESKKSPKVEASDTIQADILRTKNQDDPNSYKVRKGVVGGFKQHLSEKDEKHIDTLFDKYALNFPINNLTSSFD